MAEKPVTAEEILVKIASIRWDAERAFRLLRDYIKQTENKGDTNVEKTESTDTPENLG